MLFHYSDQISSNFAFEVAFDISIIRILQITINSYAVTTKWLKVQLKRPGKVSGHWQHP